MGEGNHDCCLRNFEKWTQSQVRVVGEGENAEELFAKEDGSAITAESGTVLTCPDCGAKNVLNEQGEFEWFDPENSELVDVETVVTAP